MLLSFFASVVNVVCIVAVTSSLNDNPVHVCTCLLQRPNMCAVRTKTKQQMIEHRPAHVLTALAHVFRALGAVPKIRVLNFNPEN